MMDATTLLDRCPFCQYRLEGLPTKHRCPECGQPFDRRWKVFPGVPPWRSVDVLGGIVLLIILFTLVLMDLRPGVWLTSTDIIFLLLFAVLWLLFAIRTTQRLCNTWMSVAVDQTGIHVIDHRKNTIVYYNWREIGEARVNWWSDRLVIRTDGKDVNLDLCSKKQAWTCAEYINSYDHPFKNE
jgi:hypothetical protein